MIYLKYHQNSTSRKSIKVMKMIRKEIQVRVINITELWLKFVPNKMEVMRSPNQHVQHLEGTIQEWKLMRIKLNKIYRNTFRIMITARISKDHFKIQEAHAQIEIWLQLKKNWVVAVWLLRLLNQKMISTRLILKLFLMIVIHNIKVEF